MLAVCNTPTPEQIHSIIDRHRTAALPFAGSSLLAHHYHEVPLLSLAWGVGQIGLPFSESGADQHPRPFASASGRRHHRRQRHANSAARRWFASPRRGNLPERTGCREPGGVSESPPLDGPHRHGPAGQQSRQQRPPRTPQNSSDRTKARPRRRDRNIDAVGSQPNRSQRERTDRSRSGSHPIAVLFLSPYSLLSTNPLSFSKLCHPENPHAWGPNRTKSVWGKWGESLPGAKPKGSASPSSSTPRKLEHNSLPCKIKPNRCKSRLMPNQCSTRSV